MKLVTFTEEEHRRLVPILQALFSPTLGPVPRACIARILRAVTVRVPARLAPASIYPSERGPHRRIVTILGTERGTDALLLSCGHVVGRATGNQRGAYCEACTYTGDEDEVTGEAER